MIFSKISTVKFRIKKQMSTTIGSCRSIYRVFRNSEFNLSIKKIASCEIDECIVMGNGPSLNEVLDNSQHFFLGKKKICVNQFARSEYFENVRPEYYLFLDSAYWEETASQKLKAIIAELCAIMKEKVTWEMKILLPVQARGENIITGLAMVNKNIEICYFNMTHVPHSEPLKFLLYKKNLAMPLAQNVLIAGIFIALNIGFKKIYILGADHSWHESIYIDDNNDLHCMEPHFYEKAPPKTMTFYKNSTQAERLKIHELFAILSRIFEGYIVLEDYARHLGSKILNASNKSCIDAFERYKIESEKVL